MLTAEQIKFMKGNKIIWGLLTEEEKGFFLRVNKLEDTIYYSYIDKEWEISIDKVYSDNCVYRLRPDWEPEPENVEKGMIPDKTEYCKYQTVNSLIDWAHIIEKNVNEILYLFKVMDEWSKEKIGNINSRMGRLEAREGKLSKTDVSFIMDNIAKLRKRIEELESKK